MTSSGDRLTALEWGVSGLLHLIRFDVVERQIALWLEFLREPERNWSTAEKVYLNNLSLALYEAHQGRTRTRPVANVLKLSDAYVLENEAVRRRVVDAIRGELMNEQNPVPREMFNSYYYVTFDQYGEKGEYYLVPLSLPLPGTAQQSARRFQDYLVEAQTPHRVAPDHADQYRTTILPAYGGITPELCRLALKGTVEATVVDWFLADPAILGKSEDYINLHRSALIAPIVREEGGHKHCDGAMVLTCTMPAAFSPPARGGYASADTRSVRDEFLRVIKNWTKAPLEELHQDLKRESRGPKSIVIWESLTNEGLSTAPLALALQNELLTAGREGIVALAGAANPPAWDVRYAVLNPDALGHAVRTVMCPGPLLAPRIICRAPVEGYVVVDPTMAQEHFQNLQRLTDPSIADAESYAAAASILNQHLKGFPPFASVNGGSGVQSPREEKAQFGILKAGNADLRILAIVQGTEGHEDVRIALERLSDAIRAGVKRHRYLPDETPPFISLLQQLWTERHDLGLVAEVQEPFVEEVYELFKSIVQTPAVHSVFVFRSTVQYVPTKGVAVAGPISPEVRKSLSDALLSYSSFWLFQRICGLLTSGPVDLSIFEGELRQPAQFIQPEGGPFPNVVVCLSNDHDINDRWISALSYLGVPVTEWIRKPRPHLSSSTVFIDVGKTDSDPVEALKEFIKKLLLKGSRTQAISRALGNATGAKVEIESIEATSKDGPHGREVDFKIVLTSMVEPISVNWKPIRTVELVLFGLDTNALLHQLSAIVSNEEKKEVRWSAAHGSISGEPRAPLAATLEGLEYELTEARKRVQDAQRASIQHNLVELPTAAIAVGKDLKQLLKQQSKLTGLRSNVGQEAWHRLHTIVSKPYWISKKDAEKYDMNATIAIVEGQLFMLSGLSGDSWPSTWDLFGGLGKKANEAVRTIFSFAIAKGLKEAMTHLSSNKGYIIGNYDVLWRNALEKSIANSLIFGNMGNLGFPPFVKDDRQRRRRVSVILATLLSGAIKHHVRCMVENGVPAGGDASPNHVDRSIRQQAGDLFRVVCQLTKIRVENYAGSDTSLVLRPNKKGTYRDLELQLKGSRDFAELGVITTWSIDQSRFPAIFVTELSLGDTFWV